MRTRVEPMPPLIKGTPAGLAVVVPSLDEIADDPSKAGFLAPQVARALTLRCAVVLSVLAATPAAIGSDEGDVPAPEERLLDVGEAADRLSVSKDYLYRHGRNLPFRVRVGRRLRFSATGLARYIRTRQGR